MEEWTLERWQQILSGWEENCGAPYLEGLERYSTSWLRQTAFLGRLLLIKALRTHRFDVSAWPSASQTKSSVPSGKESWPELIKDGFGKPQFIDGPFFNMSHSFKWVTTAVSTSHCLGIDVETVRMIPAEDLADVINDSEWQCIDDITSGRVQPVADSVTPPFRDVLIAKLWTVKEALVKCIGQPLGYSLSKVDFSQCLQVPTGVLPAPFSQFGYKSIEPDETLMGHVVFQGRAELCELEFVAERELLQMIAPDHEISESQLLN